ncbi:MULTISPECIES: hypothetical protein [Devosia]|nr:hypothetical protein [Devosia sp.]MDP2781936.1 hypothetical protein [Devosia sp.]HLV83708.1 hypothetical protein [Devosia sp.]
MNYPAEFNFASALPDAPLHMPKQQLQHRRSLPRAIIDTLLAFTGR